MRTSSVQSLNWDTAHDRTLLEVKLTTLVLFAWVIMQLLKSMHSVFTVLHVIIFVSTSFHLEYLRIAYLVYFYLLLCFPFNQNSTVIQSAVIVVVYTFTWQVNGCWFS